MNLDLLSQIRETVEELSGQLIALQPHMGWNTDENTAVAAMIEQLSADRLMLDGIFFRQSQMPESEKPMNFKNVKIKAIPVAPLLFGKQR